MLPQNVKKNLNYYEKNFFTSILGKVLKSHGEANAGVRNGQVENHDLTSTTFEGAVVDHYNIDNATNPDVISAILKIFDSLKEGDRKTMSMQDLKQFHRQQ